MSVGSDQLEGYLDLPEEPLGLVMFAQCSGSGRHDARNNRLASRLWRKSVATLLVDLVDWPMASGDVAPDMEKLVGRLDQVTSWTRLSRMLRDLPRGYFASEAGAVAAIALAASAIDIDAMVILDVPASTTLEQVRQLKSPTLFISTNKHRQTCISVSGAFNDMQAAHDLIFVDDCISRSDEQALLREISAPAIDWFTQHFLAHRPANAC